MGHAVAEGGVLLPGRALAEVVVLGGGAQQPVPGLLRLGAGLFGLGAGGGQLCLQILFVFLCLFLFLFGGLLRLGSGLLFCRFGLGGRGFGGGLFGPLVGFVHHCGSSCALPAIHSPSFKAK